MLDSVIKHYKVIIGEKPSVWGFVSTVFEAEEAGGCTGGCRRDGAATARRKFNGDSTKENCGGARSLELVRGYCTSQCT